MNAAQQQIQSHGNRTLNVVVVDRDNLAAQTAEVAWHQTVCPPGIELRVHIAHSVGEALETMHTEHDSRHGASSTVVLLELDLGEESGLDLLDAMRADRRFADVPVIAITRHPDDEQRTRCVRHGVKAFTRKPEAYISYGRVVQSLADLMLAAMADGPRKTTTSQRIAKSISDVAPSSERADAVAWERTARQAMREDDTEAAVHAWRRVCALRPDDPQPHRRLAMILFGDGRLDEARNAAKHTLEIAPHCRISRDLLNKTRTR